MALLATFRREPVVAVVAREAENQKLIKNTAFEELAKKIDEEDIQPRNIFKEIMAVYYFMRIEMGMRHRPITVEEFEVIRSKNGVNASCVMETEYENRIKFFSDRTLHLNPFPGTFNLFDPLAEIDTNFFFPPNIQDLVHEIYQKRFGRPIPRPATTPE